MDRLAVCFVPLSRVIGRTNQRPRIAVYKTARQRLITQFMRSVVAASRPNLFGKSSHRFQVVADDLRFCGEHRFDTLARTKKITGKKFDRTFRSGTPDREYRLRKNLRAAVLEIVAIDHRNNNVAKSHPGHRIRYPFGLAGIDRAG